MFLCKYVNFTSTR